MSTRSMEHGSDGISTSIQSEFPSRTCRPSTFGIVCKVYQSAGVADQVKRGYHKEWVYWRHPAAIVTVTIPSVQSIRQSTGEQLDLCAFQYEKITFEHLWYRRVANEDLEGHMGMVNSVRTWSSLNEPRSHYEENVSGQKAYILMRSLT